MPRKHFSKKKHAKLAHPIKYRLFEFGFYLLCFFFIGSGGGCSLFRDPWLKLLKWRGSMQLLYLFFKTLSLSKLDFEIKNDGTTDVMEEDDEEAVVAVLWSKKLRKTFIYQI